MTHANVKSLMASLLAVLAFTEFTVSQEYNLVSSTSAISTAESNQKIEAVVLDPETVDFVVDQFAMNTRLVAMQRSLGEIENKIKTLNVEPQSEVLSALQKHAEDLRTSSTSTKAKLDRLPPGATFDADRFKHFKNQLSWIRTRELERKQRVDQTSRENEQLRAENQTLRAELAMLKSGS